MDIVAFPLNAILTFDNVSQLGSLAKGRGNTDEYLGRQRIRRRPGRKNLHDGRQPILLHS